MIETLKEICEWQYKTFPSGSIEGTLNHLKKEVGEFEEAITQNDLKQAEYELADLFNLVNQLFRFILKAKGNRMDNSIAQISYMESVLNAKLEVLKTRKYPSQPDENGVFQHEKEADKEPEGVISTAMGVNTRPAHRFEYKGHWVLVDPNMPDEMFKNFTSLIELSNAHEKDVKTWEQTMFKLLGEDSVASVSNAIYYLKEQNENMIDELNQIRTIINADENESTFDEVERLQSRLLKKSSEFDSQRGLYAAMALQGMLANPLKETNLYSSPYGSHIFDDRDVSPVERVAIFSVKYADALIKELNKKGE